MAEWALFHSIIFLSAVIKGSPRVRAVATMRRSAGSPWNSDKQELAMQMAGESGSSSTGRFRFADIQVSISGARSRRPFWTSMANSQTEMAKTIHRPRKFAALEASGAPALIQTHARVSSTAAAICSRLCIPDFACVVEVAKNSGGMRGAPEEWGFWRTLKRNHLGRRSPISGNHNAFFFVCDVFDDREALAFKVGDGEFRVLTI